MLPPRSVLPLVALCVLGACSTTSSAGSGAPPLTADEPVAASPAPAVEHPVVTAAAVDDLQSAFKRAIAKAEPAVVSVYSTKTVAYRSRRSPFGNDPLFDYFFHRPDPAPQKFQQQGLGSGFIIDAEGYVLTNNHVVEDADEVKVKLDDDRELTAEVVGTDPPTDLALLKVEGEGLTAIELGDSDVLEVGDWVLAIGNPFGLPKTVSSGIVSAKGRANVGIVDYEDFIQTDAAVNPGNSGGPLVDLQGRVVGINTAIASRSGGNNGIAFAIPVNMAKSIVEQLRGDGKVVRGHLGVLISELSPEMARSFEYEDGNGVLVQDVSEGSAAEQAGVQNGDIITKLDGQAVTSVSKFRTEVAAKKPGSSVRLEVWRSGKTLELTASLGEVTGKGGGKAAGAPPKIGLALADVTPQLQQKLSLPESKGVVVTAVEPGSPADREGVRPGDVLAQVGSTRVESAAEAVRLLRDADLGKGVRLRIVRNGQGRYVLIRAK